MISKFDYKEHYFNEKRKSTTHGTLEIHHNLPVKELIKAMKEAESIQDIEQDERFEWVSIEYVNEEYSFSIDYKNGEHKSHVDSR